ncbi:hypothetical protein HW555_011670 [Spodoptera exigua]|uniref:Uncharacterized protein n=1 Tax=Spodoptera exigua TaxID=7107 RepID=A0A835G4Y7_SPOEX|nr:hypothetical protein HW555_011670 [Spodoptera exigua]
MTLELNEAKNGLKALLHEASSDKDVSSTLTWLYIKSGYTCAWNMSFMESRASSKDCLKASVLVTLDEVNEDMQKMMLSFFGLRPAAAHPVTPAPLPLAQAVTLFGEFDLKKYQEILNSLVVSILQRELDVDVRTGAARLHELAPVAAQLSQWSSVHRVVRSTSSPEELAGVLAEEQACLPPLLWPALVLPDAPLPPPPPRCAHSTCLLCHLMILLTGENNNLHTNTQPVFKVQSKNTRNNFPSAYLHSFVEPSVGGVVSGAGSVHGAQHGVGVRISVCPVSTRLVQAQDAQCTGDQF